MDDDTRRLLTRIRNEFPAALRDAHDGSIDGLRVSHEIMLAIDAALARHDVPTASVKQSSFVPHVDQHTGETVYTQSTGSAANGRRPFCRHDGPLATCPYCSAESMMSPYEWGVLAAATWSDDTTHEPALAEIIADVVTRAIATERAHVLAQLAPVITEIDELHAASRAPHGHGPVLLYCEKLFDAVDAARKKGVL